MSNLVYLSHNDIPLYSRDLTFMTHSKKASNKLQSTSSIHCSWYPGVGVWPTAHVPWRVFIPLSPPLRSPPSPSSNDSWLTDNCERDEKASSETVTVCNCYHLTSFALVMSPSTTPPPENHPLHIATKVGLSLSIFCLLLTVLLLFGLK